MIKKWSEMTVKEIIQLKRTQCSKCLYYSRATTTNASSSCCEYLIIKGHSRGCSPLECKERGIFNPKPRRRRKKVG